MSQLTFIFRLAAFSVFAGRAYQHLFWDAPYRTFFWDEYLLKNIVESFSSLTWHEYATAAGTDAFIKGLITGTGIFYLVCAIASLVLQPRHRKAGNLLPAGAAMLGILALLYMVERFFQVGQLLEYAAQVASPLFLYVVLYRSPEPRQLSITLKVAIALTFVCHGLYAVGYYPQPGFFIDMVIRVFHAGEPLARNLLLWMGLLDFAVAILIFIPATARPALIYCIVWGLATALARVVGNVYVDFFWQTLHQWTFEAVYRFPHALLPLAALILERVRHLRMAR